MQKVDTNFSRKRKSTTDLGDATSILSSMSDQILSIDPHARMLVEDIFSLPSDLRRPTLEKLVEMSEKYKKNTNDQN